MYNIIVSRYILKACLFFLSAFPSLTQGINPEYALLNNTQIQSESYIHLPGDHKRKSIVSLITHFNPNLHDGTGFSYKSLGTEEDPYMKALPEEDLWWLAKVHIGNHTFNGVLIAREKVLIIPKGIITKSGNLLSGTQELTKEPNRNKGRSVLFPFSPENPKIPIKSLQQYSYGQDKDVTGFMIAELDTPFELITDSYVRVLPMISPELSESEIVDPKMLVLSHCDNTVKVRSINYDMNTRSGVYISKSDNPMLSVKDRFCTPEDTGDPTDKRRFNDILLISTSPDSEGLVIIATQVKLPLMEFQPAYQLTHLPTNPITAHASINNQNNLRTSLSLLILSIFTALVAIQ